MWEKELMAKHQNKYIIKWATKPISFLAAIQVEERKDDKYIFSEPLPYNDIAQARRYSVLTDTLNNKEDHQEFENVSFNILILFKL